MIDSRYDIIYKKENLRSKKTYDEIENHKKSFYAWQFIRRNKNYSTDFQELWLEFRNISKGNFDYKIGWEPSLREVQKVFLDKWCISHRIFSHKEVIPLDFSFSTKKDRFSFHEVGMLHPVHIELFDDSARVFKPSDQKFITLTDSIMELIDFGYAGEELLFGNEVKEDHSILMLAIDMRGMVPTDLELKKFNEYIKSRFIESSYLRVRNKSSGRKTNSIELDLLLKIYDRVAAKGEDINWIRLANELRNHFKGFNFNDEPKSLKNRYERVVKYITACPNINLPIDDLS